MPLSLRCFHVSTVSLAAMNPFVTQISNHSTTGVGVQESLVFFLVAGSLDHAHTVAGSSTHPPGVTEPPHTAFTRGRSVVWSHPRSSRVGTHRGVVTYPSSRIFNDSAVRPHGTERGWGAVGGGFGDFWGVGLGDPDPSAST